VLILSIFVLFHGPTYCQIFLFYLSKNSNNCHFVLGNNTLFLFYFLVVLGFELRALHLLGSFMPRPPWNTILLFMLLIPHSWDDRPAPQHPAFIG
jgi:hypothetical protein